MRGVQRQSALTLEPTPFQLVLWTVTALRPSPPGPASVDGPDLGNRDAVREFGRLHDLRTVSDDFAQQLFQLDLALLQTFPQSWSAQDATKLLRHVSSKLAQYHWELSKPVGAISASSLRLTCLLLQVGRQRVYWNRSATESCSLCTRPIAPCSLMLFRLRTRRLRSFASDQKSSRSSAQALASYVEPGMNPSRLLLNEALDSSEDCQDLKALLASSRSWVSSYIASDERALDPKNRMKTSLSSTGTL